MSFTLGVDVGTYETKGALVDRDGAVVATAARAHKMLTPQPGWAEHRPQEDWWDDVAHVVRALLATPGVRAADVRAVGLSAIGPCMLPVDDAGAPLMNAVLYGVDVRSHAEIEALSARIGAERILDLGGNALTSQSVGPKILWLKNNRPEIYAKTALFVTSTTWLTYKLTGVWATDHYSAANTSPLYDADALSYSDALADDITPLERLPPPVWTTEVVGGVTAAAAEATGLAVNTPVIAGTIDAAAEAISVGARETGDMMMMYGSTIFIIQVVERRVRDPRLWYAPWLFPGRHAAMAGLATSGTLTHWFRDQFARDLPKDDAFAVLAAEAATAPPGANGLVLLPYFSGERTPIHDPHARGVLFGLDLTHTRADIYRALIEGIALGARHVVDAYRDAGAPPARVLAVGGGVKNEIWLQATSDVTGLGQVVREKTLGAAYGDAFLAALGIGDARPEDIDAWNLSARAIAPSQDPVTRAAYERNYHIFRGVYDQTKHLMAELARRDDRERPAP